MSTIIFLELQIEVVPVYVEFPTKVKLSTTIKISSEESEVVPVVSAKFYKMLAELERGEDRGDLA